MELHVADSSLMELESLVRSGRQVHIEPHYSAIIAAKDNVVSRRVDIHRRQPLAATEQALHKFLLHEMEYLYMLLSHNKEKWQRGVECK